MTRRMTAIGLLAGLLAAISPVACGPRPQGANPPPPTVPIPPPAAPTPPPMVPTPPDAGTMIIQSTRSVRWSSKLDPEARRALVAGRRRLAIDVKAYQPPTTGAATLVAYLLTADGTKRQEIDRFGIHPNAPFKASAGVDPQRFLISLEDLPGLLETSEIHLEVGFDRSNPQLQGGMAEISLEFVDL